MAKLVEIAGYTPGREIPVGDSLYLGRDPGPGGLVIANREASRRHARIYRQGSSYLVEDLNSANGTFVDGVRQLQSALSDGSVLTIGRTTFRFNHDLHSRPAEPTANAAAMSIGNVAVPGNRTPEPKSPEIAPLSIEGTAAPSSSGSRIIPAPPPRSAPRSSPVWNLTIDARVTGLRAQGSQDSENLRRERDILNHLCEISRTLGSILHLPALVQEILSKLFELFPAAENASIHLIDSGSLSPLAARSRGGGPTVAPAISQTIASLALADRQSILSTDAAEDARFLDKESIILQKVRSFMCSPLLFRDEALGVLYVDTTDARPRFTVDDLHLFTAVSAQVAVAVKNSQLMAENLREAEVRLHLSRYLPPDLVEQVLNHQIDLNPGGSLVEGTVLFSDVVGFTPMAERLGPELLVQTLNRYFKHMVGSIFRYGGSVNAFGGDSIMALWGVPVQRENDALLAVCSALEMQAAIFAFNATWRDGEVHPLRVGIGVNTGRFVVGNIGSEQHMEYTALGNEVNVAQRVESQAAGWQVFLSENNYRHVADRVSVFVLPPKALKGVTRPLPIYSVRAVRYGEETLCAIPATLTLPDGVDVASMVARRSADGDLEVLAPVELTDLTEVSLRLEPPEAPSMSPMTACVRQASPLGEFEIDPGRRVWRLCLRPNGQPSPLLEPPLVLSPEPGREYLPRR